MPPWDGQQGNYWGGGGGGGVQLVCGRPTLALSSYLFEHRMRAHPQIGLVGLHADIYIEQNAPWVRMESMRVYGTSIV